jgi:hypothetical protein
MVLPNVDAVIPGLVGDHGGLDHSPVPLCGVFPVPRDRIAHLVAEPHQAHLHLRSPSFGMTPYDFSKRGLI